MKINAALCSESKPGSWFRKAKECREADYLTSPLLMKSTLKSGASHPPGSETTVLWDGADAGLTAWCDVMNMILALHNILSAFLCISLHSYCSSPSLPVDFLPAFQATGKVMPTVCACEDSYHRQVQGGSVETTWTICTSVFLSLCHWRSPCSSLSFSLSSAIALLHLLLFFPSIHHSPCVRASLSLSQIFP